MEDVLIYSEDGRTIIGCDITFEGEIIVPEGVECIAEKAFFGCEALTSIHIPNSVISIGDSAFYGCNKLKEIIIPKGTRTKFEKMLPKDKDKFIESEQLPTKSAKEGNRLLFFDTETTGLPSDYNAPSTDLPNWPRLVQISWIVSDDMGEIISKENHIVKPNGFTIPDDVAKIHGITTEKALEIGENLEEVLNHFWEDVQKSDIIIGHNVSFDESVVEAEFYRIGENHVFSFNYSICTKLVSTDYCKIPNPWNDKEYKWPKLSELYYKLFNKELVDAHDSAIDVQATFDCFWRLKELGVVGNIDIDGNIIEEQQTYNKKMHFTTFLLNSSVLYGYGKPCSNFSERLYVREWRLFVSNEPPQNLMFSYPNTLHLMENGRGISGTYSLKDKDSLLLSLDGDIFYLHCVYCNEEIIIFQFDQSNEHVLLYQKHLVFSAVSDIHNYLVRVKNYIDAQKEDARKKKEIELKEQVDSLVIDINRCDVEISDKRVESLKIEIEQLASIVGQEEANKYRPLIDEAIKTNEEKKRIIEEEKREKEAREKEEAQKKKEEWKRKKTEWGKKILFTILILLYVTLWTAALYYFYSNDLSSCSMVILVASIISFFVVFFSSYVSLFIGTNGCMGLLGWFALWPRRGQSIPFLMGIITIICSCIYLYDWSMCYYCLNDRGINPFMIGTSRLHSSSSLNGDEYLNETTYHLFDNPVKRIISEEIDNSRDVEFLKMYISQNKSGYYLQESIDKLCSEAETIEDWKYIIENAPDGYKAKAEKKLDELCTRLCSEAETIEDWKYIIENAPDGYKAKAEKKLDELCTRLCSEAETLGDWKYIIDNGSGRYKAKAEKNYAHLDSVVWNDEELAYKNAKSLKTYDAYARFIILHWNSKYALEMSDSASKIGP